MTSDFMSQAPMLIVPAAFFLGILFLLRLGKSRPGTHADEEDRYGGPTLTRNKRPGDGSDSSVIPSKFVQVSIATGAPPPPWIPSLDDRRTMTTIEKYFARAIPNPTKDGRPYVAETLGHGGPQLELFVPIVSAYRPVAVLARNWDPAENALVSQLFFAGTVEGRLGEIVRNLGYEQTGGSSSGSLTVFRNRRGFIRKRAG